MKTPCIITHLAKDKDGYGKASLKGKTIGAHRLAWIKHHGSIPTGMLVCHSCDNPSCVNVDHLFLGTWASNMVDRDRKGRNAKGERAGLAKLTEDQVLRIRASTNVHTEIAKEFGVCIATVSNIRTKKTWKHV